MVQTIKRPLNILPLLAWPIYYFFFPRRNVKMFWKRHIRTMCRRAPSLWSGGDTLVLVSRKSWGTHFNRHALHDFQPQPGHSLPRSNFQMFCWHQDFIIVISKSMVHLQWEKILSWSGRILEDWVSAICCIVWASPARLDCLSTSGLIYQSIQFMPDHSGGAKRGRERVIA